MRGCATPHAVGFVLALNLLGPALRAADPPLTSRKWISVKGVFDDAGVFVADEIELLDEQSASIKGGLDASVAATGELRFGPLRLALDPDTRFLDQDGESIDADRLTNGRRVKVALALEDPEGPRVRRVRLLPESKSTRIGLKGPVETVPIQTGRALYFKLFGQTVQADAHTTWEGVEPPWSRVDEEDRRPGRGIGLGGLGRLSGELRLDYIAQRNFDLADPVETDLDTLRLRGRLEWVFPSTKRVSGMIQIGWESENAVLDPAEAFESQADLFLRRAYVTVHGVLGKYGSIQVGRVHYDDDRDWLYNRNLDAVRLLFDHPRFHMEASFSQEIVDPTKRHRDVMNKHLLVGTTFARRHVLEAYVFDRQDDLRRTSGITRDFSPRLIGLRASGEGEKIWSYWLEASLARGSVDHTPLDGQALDVGVTLVAPVDLEPSLTVGYAYGSGDDDPFDGVDHTFRQTGLQLNNGRWNGVTNFRYYGELLRPELANLHVQTYGIGLRPLRKTSIDLIYHVYRLDTLAAEFVDTDVEDRRMNLTDLDVGREWDIVIGYEQLRHYEFELDLSYFDPGDAFLGPTDGAYSARLKMKYVF